MFGIKLCSPALIYLVFSLTQVVVDTIKGLYNVALLKFSMLVLFTLLLNILCERGLSLVSWIIVFVPFILMSVITSILLFVFGLDPTSGKIVRPGHPQPSPHHYAKPAPHHHAKPAPHHHGKPTPHHHNGAPSMSERELHVRKELGEDLDGVKNELSKKASSLHHAADVASSDVQSFLHKL